MEQVKPSGQGKFNTRIGLHAPDIAGTEDA